MKHFAALLLAGATGGLITLTAFLGIQQFFSEDTQLATPTYPVKWVNNVNVPKGFDTGEPFDFSEAAALAIPAVVHIKSTVNSSGRRHSENPWSRFFGDEDLWGNPFFGFDYPRSGTGSGVIYTPDGFIITNHHVIENADKIEVTTYDNHVYEARLVGSYADGDLAVLKIDAVNLPTLRLADSDAARIGEWVLAIGNPLELNSTVTAGIISARGRDLNIIRGQAPIESFIQTDAAVNPGNSGGALVDASGRLLGINTAIATQSGFYEGYSFAIPINLARKIVDAIIANGSYERGFLGINIADIDIETARELNLEAVRGVLVDSVIEGGAADEAGIQANDVIIGVNGKEVKATPDLLEVVGGLEAGETVTLTILRNGRIHNLTLKLKAAR